MEDSGQDCDDREDEPHQCHRQQQQRSAAYTSWEESEANGAREGKHGGRSSDQCLVETRGYADIVKHLVVEFSQDIGYKMQIGERHTVCR